MCDRGGRRKFDLTLFLSVLVICIDNKHAFLIYASNEPKSVLVRDLGESGCGKSTIAGMLAAKNRGYNGEITIGGVPLNEVNETNLMQRVVLVRHNSYLFKGTVEENLKIIAKTFEIASLKAAW